MLELRHNPWCEGLDCVDSLEEPLEGDLEGDLDMGGTPLEGAASQDDTISSSLQLVLPSDFAPSRVNSKLAVITSPADPVTCSLARTAVVLAHGGNDVARTYCCELAWWRLMGV